VFRRQSVPDLVRDAEVKGVSGWTQPILAYPGSPVVLVEGYYDTEALYHTARIAGDVNVRFLTLPGLDPAERSGQGLDRRLPQEARRPPGEPASRVSAGRCVRLGRLGRRAEERASGLRRGRSQARGENGPRPLRRAHGKELQGNRALLPVSNHRGGGQSQRV
jgi:hypothetical protein